MSGNLFATYPTGELVDPFALRAEQVHARDIAHHLSNEPRYGGGTRRHYSVGEHSVIVSVLAQRHADGITLADGPTMAAKWGLMHEAFEAYAKDIPAGQKHRTYVNVGVQDDCVLVPYSEVEEAFLRDVVAPKFGLAWPIPRTVGEVDRMICASEMRLLSRRACDTSGRPLKGAIPGLAPGMWSPEEAQTRWLARFVELWGSDADALLGVP